MILNFGAFAAIVASSFQQLVNAGPVFTTGVEGDDLYATYLGAFPEGTNPIYKVRTEHDCSCCRQFIRRVGNVVAVAADGQLRTIWDAAAREARHPYDKVASALRDKVRGASINGIFRVPTKETSFGAKTTLSQDPLTGVVNTWEHFHTGPIPDNLRVASPGQVCGDYATTVAVFHRGLQELSPAAVDEVLSLITSGSLYRGAEHKDLVIAFRMSQRAFQKLTSTAAQSQFLWVHAGDSAARFRGTVIGTLVQDLSSGMNLEAAVRAFETKVAPQNYKRTTALVTPMMVQTAMKTIADLDLEPALERRLATLSDIAVTDVLWSDGSARPLMKGGIGDILMSHARSTSNEKVDGPSEAITMEDFVTKVLPTATEMELLFTGRHLGNLMVLTAPVRPEPKQLFRWSNDFAWSYNGNVTDSIAERVKRAGGKVEGAQLRVSLSWYNYDDLDLHVREPHGRGAHTTLGHIYYANRRGWTGGVLDVDMNARVRQSREPVENVVWSQGVPNGTYKVEVNSYEQRERSDPGFVVEIENAGKLTHYSYAKTLRTQQSLHVCTLRMKDGCIESVDAGDPAVSTAAIKSTRWNLTTEQFVKVNLVTFSPNFWGDSKTGNKHTFFVLEGCATDEEMRGIYNEFLHPRLEPHRKVFELIGDKTKCAITENHIAGLGFSSTKKDEVIVRVRTGSSRRTYNVKIG